MMERGVVVAAALALRTSVAASAPRRLMASKVAAPAQLGPTKRLKLPALVAMELPLRPIGLWPFEALRRGYALVSEVVGQLQGEEPYRMHLNHTLFDAACDFARNETRVLQELGMCQHAEGEHRCQYLLRLMGEMGSTHMDYAKQCLPQLPSYLLRPRARDMGTGMAAQ